MAEQGLPEQGTEPETPEAPVVKRTRVIARAEDIEIGFMEDDEAASSQPIGWKAARQNRAAAKPPPIPIPAPVNNYVASEDGSPLSVNGDGW